MEKPPLAPKPRYIPQQKAVPQALNVDSSQSPINTVKSTHFSQPHLSKPPTPEWKSVSVFSSDYQSHFQQAATPQGLLHPRTKEKHDIESGQASVSTPYKVQLSSADQLNPAQATQSQGHGTVKKNLNLVNGSLASKRNATSILDAPHLSSTNKFQSKPVLLIPTQSRHSADEHSDHSSSVLLPVEKASPISVQNKAKSSHVGQPEKRDVTSQEKGGYNKPMYKALTVNESNLTQLYKEGRTPIKQKKSRSRPEAQNDNVEPLGNYSHWKVLPSEQKAGQDAPNDSRSENTPRKRSGITLKPKVKSLNQADLKESLKKLKDFKLFSKGGQGPESTAGKDEQSVDQGWHTTKIQNRSQITIPQYRTHHVNIQQDDFTVEHSVDGDCVENEHPYSDGLDSINVCGTQRPQTPTNWQRNVFNKEERMNGKIGESEARVGQDYNKR